jgi:hypothetical protein
MDEYSTSGDYTNLFANEAETFQNSNSNDSTTYTGNPVGDFTEAQIDSQIRDIEPGNYSDKPAPMYFSGSDPSLTSTQNLGPIMQSTGGFNFNNVLDSFNRGVSGVAGIYATVERARGIRDQAAIDRSIREGNRAVTQANIERDKAAGVAGVPLRKGLGFNAEQTAPENVKIQKIVMLMGIAGAIYVIAKKVKV